MSWSVTSALGVTITLKGSQMLASGSVGFGEECEGVVDSGELGCLAYLPLVVLVGSFQNGLPYVMRERLISLCSICQLSANPDFCDFFVSVYPVIYVPGAFWQCSVDLLDSLHSLSVMSIALPHNLVSCLRSLSTCLCCRAMVRTQTAGLASSIACSGAGVPSVM